jgi:hypothetical protein
MAIVLVVAAGAAHLLLWGRRAVWSAAWKSVAVTLATQKMASLESLLWEVDPAGTSASDETTDLSTEPPQSNGTGLQSSPGGTLTSNTPGFVDYVDADGQWRGTGVQAPAGAAFVRRWSIEPFATDPTNTLVLTVVVFPLADAAVSAGLPERGARLSTIRTRVAR